MPRDDFSNCHVPSVPRWNWVVCSHAGRSTQGRVQLDVI
jgi:hypothetical protein